MDEKCKSEIGFFAVYVLVIIWIANSICACTVYGGVDWNGKTGVDKRIYTDSKEANKHGGSN